MLLIKLIICMNAESIVINSGGSALCSSRLFGLLAHCTLCKLITRHHSFNQVAFTVSLFCVSACVYPTAHEELKNMFSASFSSVPFIPFSLMLNAKCARLDDRFWHVSIYWPDWLNLGIGYIRWRWHLTSQIPRRDGACACVGQTLTVWHVSYCDTKIKQKWYRSTLFTTGGYRMSLINDLGITPRCTCWVTIDNVQMICTMSKD